VKTIRHQETPANVTATGERVIAPRGLTKLRTWVRTAPGVATCAALYALLIRAVSLISAPFDGLYGQDAYFYLQASRTLASIWSDPSKLWGWLTIAGTPPVSVWPLGYHVQMALASLLVGPGPASGQVLSLTAGVLTPAFTALLFVRLTHLAGYTEGTQQALSGPAWFGALCAGLIMASSAVAVRASVVVMADMTGAMWATLGALLVLHYSAGTAPRTRSGLAAGLALAVASVTRYIYPLMLFPSLAQLALRTESERTRLLTLSSVIRRSVPVVVPVVVLVGLQLLHNRLHPTPGLPSPVISNWSPANAFASSFDTSDGHLSYNMPMFFFFLARPLYAPTMLGSAFGILSLVGAVVVTRRHFSVIPLTIGWWLLFALFYSGNTYQADRFVLSYLPPLAVLSGWGLMFLMERATGFALSLTSGAASRLALALPLLFALAGLFVLTSASASDYRQLVDGKNDYLAATNCLKAHAGMDATIPIITFGATFTVQQYTGFAARDLYYETPKTLADSLGPSNGTTLGYLLLPLSGFEAQWGGTAMGEAYRSLKANYKLEPLSCPGSSLSLFAIR
jgi:hypothetical protein